jgi:hypothetical protein
MKRNLFFALTLCFAATGLFLTTGSVMAPPETHRKMAISSTAFKDGQPIPRRYTCAGENISPPLAWNGAPDNAASLALIVDDPDAPGGVWTHWIVFDLPPDLSELPENAGETAGGSGRQGLNNFKHPNYDGPCPPPGKPHRYFFKIYALDIKLGLPSGASRGAVSAAMTKHILAEGQFMGTCQKN